MKKLVLASFIVLLATTMVFAQGTTKGAAGSYVPAVDVLGAHQNGGRGCAGCHAPHSGARGNGWVSATGVASAMNSGDQALWGTDVTAIMGASITFDPGDGGVALPWTPSSTSFSGDPLFKDVATCLSCHDGNVSKGAMMTGQSWEQAQGILPAGYGTGTIPTYLGNDGAGAGDYSNDHPLGPASAPGAGDGASLGASDVGQIEVANGDITLTITNGRLKVGAITGAYLNFTKNYGAPQLNRWAVPANDTNVNDVYIVCTTCHDQHSMVAYQSGNHGAPPIVGATAGASTYQTYFFVAAPYNPGAPYDKTHAPSTDQFCRQCHWPQSNEYYGSNNIGTAF